MSEDLENRLQLLDVSVVDVLSHLEALLRHSHSVQRALLQLHSEASPPPIQMAEEVSAAFTRHVDEMHREWAMLGDIIRDFRTGLNGFSGESDVSERRSGLDRRRADPSTPSRFTMPRGDCFHCGVLEMVHAEHTIRAREMLTTYFCDACHSEWDEAEGGRQVGATRTRPPKTHRDKTS